MSSEIYLPTLHSFAMGNAFTGSSGLLRFKITPAIVEKNKMEVDMEQSSLRAELWHGIFCYEKSDMEQEKIFPLSEAGREELRQWLQAAV